LTVPDFGDQQPGQGRHDTFGTVDPLAPSVSNGQITPEQWAEYQAKRKKDAILGSLLTLGGMFGGGALGGALGGGGSASSAGAGASPAFGVGAANTGIWSGAATAPSIATGALGAGGGAGASSLLGGMSARDLAAIGLSLGGTIGGAMSKPQNMSPTTQTSDPNLQALMQAMQRRLDKSEPLYDSVLNMANGLLPTQYQKGGGGMG
jgi:hypothetical protein